MNAISLHRLGKGICAENFPFRAEPGLLSRRGLCIDSVLLYKDERVRLFKSHIRLILMHGCAPLMPFFNQSRQKNLVLDTPNDISKLISSQEI